MFSPLTTVVSSGLGRRTWRSNQWMCELELESPIQLLCSMRRLVLQNLMSIQPGSVASLISWVHSSSTQDGVMTPPTLSLPSLMPSVVSCDLVGGDGQGRGIKFPVMSISSDPSCHPCA
ncbi:unnamed protein product [Microthlaspi erraticum]|uniref:Uncharacterized protein n=1 Tax=Microthlaspi erraticum TaxID=1685480 RepID=A0A6D2IPM2_9BRAS|nr:unnamed protein product [Microthlaspi erraticum]